MVHDSRRNCKGAGEKKINADHYHNLGLAEISGENMAGGTARPREPSGELALKTGV